MKNYSYIFLLFGILVSWSLPAVQQYEAQNVSEVFRKPLKTTLEDPLIIIPMKINGQGEVVGQLISGAERNIHHLFYLDAENTILLKPIRNELENVFVNSAGDVAGNIKGSSAPFIWNKEENTLESIASWDECTKYIGFGLINLTPKVHDIEESGEILLSCAQRNISNARDIYNNFGENFESTSKFLTLLKKMKDVTGDAVFGDHYAYLVDDGEVEPTEIPFSKVRTLSARWNIMGSLVYRTEEGANVPTIQLIERMSGAPYLFDYPLDAHIIDTNHSGDALALSKGKTPTLYLWKVPTAEDEPLIESLFVSDREVQDGKLNDNGVVFFRNPEGSFRLKEGKRDKIEAYDNDLAVSIREIIDVNSNGEILIEGYTPEDDFFPIGYWILKPVED